ncbi:MAG: hypothetical protein ACAI43_03760, partial [Phycisphaerae bacterium]
TGAARERVDIYGRVVREGIAHCPLLRGSHRHPERSEGSRLERRTAMTAPAAMWAKMNDLLICANR